MNDLDRGNIDLNLLWRYDASVQSKYAISKVDKKKKESYNKFSKGFFVYKDLLYFKCDADYTMDSEGYEISFDLYKELKSSKIFTKVHINFVPIGVFNSLMTDIAGVAQYMLATDKEISDLKSTIIDDYKRLSDPMVILND